MKEHELNRLLDNPEIVEEKIRKFVVERSLFKHPPGNEEVIGHLLKAEHNLRFVADIIDQKYIDWAITGCYYASYHAALALILTKGYSSKLHAATLCVIIKEFYDKELTKSDIEMLSNFFDYEDVLFYVESKNKREEASYSTKTLFDKKEVEMLRQKAAIFVNKAKEIANRAID